MSKHIIVSEDQRDPSSIMGSPIPRAGHDAELFEIIVVSSFNESIHYSSYALVHIYSEALQT